MRGGHAPIRLGHVSHRLAFLAPAAVVIVTPGPDTALTVRNSLLGGLDAVTGAALVAFGVRLAAE
jgi:threonine/homoserine/homoserine lactone efflux protein